MNDIRTEADIALLIDEFYNEVAKDEKIGHHFEQVDWDNHKPRMRAFWEYILLDKPATIHSIYTTHERLNLQPRDFEVWMQYFTQTIDRLFSGSKAELAKQRATIIAYTFNSKMNPETELNLDFLSKG